MNPELADFERFLQLRSEAAEAFVNGDAEAMARLITAAPPATFFGPGGGVVQGPGEVDATFRNQAAPFQEGRSRFEVLQIAAADDLACWAGLQLVTALMKGKAEPTQFKLRVSEIFRKEGGGWKLVHRHADALG
jgi:ketosteroid isomerase-like protein